MEENLFHVYFLYFLKNQNEQQSLRTKKPSNPLSSFVFPILSFTNHNTFNPPNPKESQTESRQKPSIIFFFLFDSQRCFEFSRLKARRTERKKRKTDRALSRASLVIAFDDWGSWKGRGGRRRAARGRGRRLREENEVHSRRSILIVGRNGGREKRGGEERGWERVRRGSGNSFLCSTVLLLLLLPHHPFSR